MINKLVRARKQVKADRSAEMGVAGHQAAMKALGTAAGNWERVGMTSLSNHGADGSARPGFGHVTTLTEDEFSHSGVDKQPMGFQGILPKNTAKVESNVLDRHKPTKDF